MHLAEGHDIHPKLRPFAQLVQGLAKILGDDCEVLLHDVSRLERSIVACANGHVTGRPLGAPMSVYGLELLSGDVFSGSKSVYIYMARANNGKLVKCGVIAIRDDDGEIIGLMCLHFDITKAIAARDLLDAFFLSGGIADAEPVNEFFGLEIEDIFGNAFQEIKGQFGKPVSELSKTQKKIVIKNLINRGFFLMKGSVEYAAKQMGNSKFTIYGYIREIEKD
ncbi:MAG: helix-turn-helix transcriptional regulator [Synergistaceae bacterium]|jgi:predicted transcriptional regulator YheO|nr:helix-turn-helix transcriptional regulator [Synergistaceae bacterium]